MPLEFEKGGELPIPCRHCGRISRYKIEEGSGSLFCTSCSRQTIVTVKRRGAEWIITTAPDGAGPRKS
jgi:hypothetical protein